MKLLTPELLFVKKPAEKPTNTYLCVIDDNYSEFWRPVVCIEVLERFFHINPAKTYQIEISDEWSEGAITFKVCPGGCLVNGVMEYLWSKVEELFDAAGLLRDEGYWIKLKEIKSA